MLSNDSGIVFPFLRRCGARGDRSAHSFRLRCLAFHFCAGRCHYALLRGLSAGPLQVRVAPDYAVRFRLNSKRHLPRRAVRSANSLPLPGPGSDRSPGFCTPEIRLMENDAASVNCGLSGFLWNYQCLFLAYRAGIREKFWRVNPGSHGWLAAVWRHAQLDVFPQLPSERPHFYGRLRFVDARSIATP